MPIWEKSLNRPKKVNYWQRDILQATHRLFLHGVATVLRANNNAERFIIDLH